jgi:GMP synthase (glutamine-hydrolysing)
MREHSLLGTVSQMPVVLFPVNFGISGSRAIALRPFKTPDFMTGIPGRPGSDIPEAVLNEIVSTILKEVPGIAGVVLDLSSKPPATTEWE